MNDKRSEEELTDDECVASLLAGPNKAALEKYGKLWHEITDEERDILIKEAGVER